MPTWAFAGSQVARLHTLPRGDSTAVRLFGTRPLTVRVDLRG
ncbi:hypothetical protein [Streptomyces sp. NPDC060027]